jgi:hypothetical protein
MKELGERWKIEVERELLERQNLERLKVSHLFCNSSLLMTL